MTYNHKRYLELVKRSKDFQNEIQFKRESEDEYLEFITYREAIGSYLL